MTPGQVTITCAECGKTKLVWRSWADGRNHFCCPEHFHAYLRVHGRKDDARRLTLTRAERKQANRERKMMRLHVQAHDLMVVVVTCSDRMEAVDIAHLMGVHPTDVECMIRAYESMGQFNCEWPDIMIRRYLVAKHCPTKTDRELA